MLTKYAVVKNARNGRSNFIIFLLLESNLCGMERTLAPEAPLLDPVALGFVLIGASATGKSTLALHLQAMDVVTIQPTLTTRPLRDTEQAAACQDHRFVSQSAYNAYLQANAVVAQCQLYGYDYAVPLLRVGTRLPLAVLKPCFVEPMAQRYPNFRVYQLETSEATVHDRMTRRGQSEPDILARLKQHALEVATGRRLADCIFRNESSFAALVGAVYAQIKQDMADHALMLQ